MKELKEKLARALKAARDIAAQAEAEGREFTGEERSALKKALDEVTTVKAEIKARQDDDGVGGADGLRRAGEQHVQ